MTDDELEELTIPQLTALQVRVDFQLKVKRRLHKIAHIARMLCSSVEGNSINSKQYEKIASDIIPIIETYEVAQGYSEI